MPTVRKELGTHKLPNEVRGCFKHGVDTRSAKVKVWVEISHPKLKDFEKPAVKCATGCATGALIVALATGGGASGAWAAFEKCFMKCLSQNISEAASKKTKIKFGKEFIRGKWSGH